MWYSQSGAWQNVVTIQGASEKLEKIYVRLKTRTPC